MSLARIRVLYDQFCINRMFVPTIRVS